MRFQSLHFWHRYLGLTAALFVILLALTGLLVQHADQLELDQHYLANHLLNRIYGIEPDSVVSFATVNDWVSQCGETLYLEDRPVLGEYHDLQGAVETMTGIAVAVDHALLLLTPEGEVLDHLTTDNGLPERILGLANSADNSLVVRGLNTYWETDDELLHWAPYTGPHPVWAAPSKIPLDLHRNIQQHNLNQEISWERLVLDLHSGRLFGQYGVYLMDISAIAMLLLAMSGVWLWLQRRV